MNEMLKKAMSVTLGSSTISFIARVVIALLMLYTGAATSVGDAVGIAVNKDRSIAAAVVLINETPGQEIDKALVKEEVVVKE
jgi:hypothetical protein